MTAACSVVAVLAAARLLAGATADDLSVQPPRVPLLEEGPWVRLGEHVDWGNNFRVPAEVFVPLHLGPGAPLTYNDATGEYFDVRRQRVVTDPREVDRLYDWHHPPMKSYLASFLELVVTLGAYSVWYVYDSLREPSAWRWPATAEGRIERDVRLQGLRFDANHMRYNSPGHPVAGALYYGVLRTNGMSSLESLIGATLASFYWEFIAEMREVISVNDMLQTPLGGANLAEAYHQVGRFCLRGDGSVVPRICAALFGTPSLVHAPLTRERFPAPLEADELGFPADTWHAFVFSSRGGVRGSTRFLSAAPQAELDVDLELGTVRHLRTDDTPIHKLVLDTMAVRLQVRGASGGEVPSVLLDYALLKADVLWGGLALQEVFATPGGRLGRVSLTAGLGSTYEHYETDITTLWQYDRRNDFMASTAWGPALDVALRVGGATARLGVEAFGDFAGVRARAYDVWLQSHDAAGIKAPLRRHAYYWAAGAAGQVRLVLETGRMQVGGSVRLNGWRSLDILDQERETLDRGKDPAVWDARTWTTAWLNTRLWGPLRLVRAGVRGEVISRHGWMDRAQDHRVDARALWEFALQL